MLRLEAFVHCVYDTTLGAQAGTQPLSRCLLLKLDGQPAVKLPLGGSELSFAPLAPEAQVAACLIQFEPLLLARATGSWALGPAPGVAVGSRQQQLQLHVIYTSTAAGDSSSSSGGGGGSPSVLGVGRLELPLPPPYAETGQSLGLPQQTPQPIQLEALRSCELSCPTTGRAMGVVSLAARLSCLPPQPPAGAPAASPSPTKKLSIQQQAGSSTTVRVNVACGVPSPFPPAATVASLGAGGAQRRHVSTQASPAKQSAAGVAVGAAVPPLLQQLGTVSLLACHPPFFVPALCAAGLVGASMPQTVALYPAWQPLPVQPAVPPGPAPAVLQPPAPPPLAVPEVGSTPAAPASHPESAGAEEGRGWGAQQQAEQGKRDLPGSSLRTPRQRGRLHFHSPLKSTPTPLVLEHRLQGVPRSRSPGRRHVDMVKSALHDGHAFYCPGCIEPFLRLPQSPGAGGAQAREAAAWCSGSCRHCRSSLAAGASKMAGREALDGREAARPPSASYAPRSPNRAGGSSADGWAGHCSRVIPGPTAAEGSTCEAAAAGAGPADACSACQCCASVQAAQCSQPSQPGTAPLPPSSARSGPLPAAPSSSSSASSLGKGAPPGAEAAAFAQLLANLNLTSDWRALLLQSLGAAPSSSLPAGAITPTAAAGAVPGAARAPGAAPSEDAATEAAAVLPPDVVANALAASPGEGGSGGRGSSRAGFPRQKPPPEGAATATAGQPDGGASRRASRLGTGPAAAATRESGTANGGEVPGGQQQRQQEAVAPSKQRRNNCRHCSSTAAGAGVPPRACTTQDIVSRNRQLLQRLQASKSSEELELASESSAGPAALSGTSIGGGSSGSWHNVAQRSPREASAQAPAASARGAASFAAREPSRGSFSAAGNPTNHPSVTGSPRLPQSPRELIGASWHPAAHGTHTHPLQLAAAAPTPSGGTCEPAALGKDASLAARGELPCEQGEREVEDLLVEDIEQGEQQGEGLSAEDIVAHLQSCHWNGELSAGPSSVLDSTIASGSEAELAWQAAAAAEAAIDEQGEWEEGLGAAGQRGGGAEELEQVIGSGWGLASGGSASAAGDGGVARSASEEYYDDDFEPASDDD